MPTASIYSALQTDKRFDFNADDSGDVPSELLASVAVGCARSFYKRLPIRGAFDVDDLCAHALSVVFSLNFDERYTIGQKVVYARKAAVTQLQKLYRDEIRRMRRYKCFGVIDVESRRCVKPVDYRLFKACAKRALQELRSKKHRHAVAMVARGCSFSEAGAIVGVSHSTVALIVAQYKVETIKQYALHDYDYTRKYFDALRRRPFGRVCEAFISGEFAFSTLQSKYAGYYNVTLTSATSRLLSLMRAVYQELDEA